MSKKNKHPQKPQAGKPELTAPSGPLISKRGKITIGIGVLVVAVGFYVLSLTDPAGQNWASHLCPFMILGGYAIIGIGIILPDPEPVVENQPLPKQS
ncbi:MAG TPA: hypothetical protein PK876_09485 [Elusimicrobiota bacterium]|nr:hypothetical protein [Elusimicrobiota bacterium]